MSRELFSVSDANQQMLGALREPLDILRLLDSALASPNNSEAERGKLLALRAQTLDALPDGRARAELVDEGQLWTAVSATVTAAVTFWVAFMQMRGATKDDALTADQIGRLACITRAVSWVETRHGTDPGNRGAVDPMQMGNPADIWWKELTGQTANTDRFVGGPGAGKYNADDLPAAAISTGMPIPAAPDVSAIDKALGHNDASFTKAISYYWGVAYLFLRINHTVGGDPFYLCRDLSYDRLFEGAVKYNGNPAVEVQYRQRLTDSLNATGCLA